MTHSGSGFCVPLRRSLPCCDFAPNALTEPIVVLTLAETEPAHSLTCVCRIESLTVTIGDAQKDSSLPGKFPC
jgi:hypothetical protein